MADWQEIPDDFTTLSNEPPFDGENVLLYFPGEMPDIRIASWVHRQQLERGTVVREEIGWLMKDRAEIREPRDPDQWLEIPRPTPPADSPPK